MTKSKKIVITDDQRKDLIEVLKAYFQLTDTEKLTAKGFLLGLAAGGPPKNVA